MSRNELVPFGVRFSAGACPAAATFLAIAAGLRSRREDTGTRTTVTDDEPPADRLNDLESSIEHEACKPAELALTGDDEPLGTAIGGDAERASVGLNHPAEAVSACSVQADMALPSLPSSLPRRAAPAFASPNPLHSGSVSLLPRPNGSRCSSSPPTL